MKRPEEMDDEEKERFGRLANELIDQCEHEKILGRLSNAELADQIEQHALAMLDFTSIGAVVLEEVILRLRSSPGPVCVTAIDVCSEARMPEERKNILWWCSQHGCWHFGSFYPQGDASYFWSPGCTQYVPDVRFWMHLPPSPTLESSDD